MTEIKILQQKKDKVGRKTLFQNRAFFNLIKIIILYKLINNKVYQEKICIFLIFDNYKIRTPKWCAIFVI